MSTVTDGLWSNLNASVMNWQNTDDEPEKISLSDEIEKIPTRVGKGISCFEAAGIDWWQYNFDTIDDPDSCPLAQMPKAHDDYHAGANILGLFTDREIVDAGFDCWARNEEESILYYADLRKEWKFRAKQKKEALSRGKV